MHFLYEYMDSDELELAKEQAQFENIDKHFQNQFHKLTLEHALRLNDIDTACLIKESTIDELEALYEREMLLYSEGVKEAWEKFKKWVRNLFNKLLGKSDESAKNIKGKDGKQKIELPFNPKEVPSTIDKVTEAVRKHTIYKDKNTGKWNVDGIFVTVLGITGGASVITLFNKFKQSTTITIEEAHHCVKSITGSTKNLTDEIQKQNPSDSEEESLIQKLTTPVLNKAQEFINTIMNTIHKVTHGKGKDASSDNGDSEQPKEGTNVPDLEERVKRTVDAIKSTLTSEEYDLFNKAIKWAFDNGLDKPLDRNGKSIKIIDPALLDEVIREVPNLDLESPLNHDMDMLKRISAKLKQANIPYEAANKMEFKSKMATKVSQSNKKKETPASNPKSKEETPPAQPKKDTSASKDTTKPKEESEASPQPQKKDEPTLSAEDQSKSKDKPKKLKFGEAVKNALTSDEQSEFTKAINWGIKHNLVEVEKRDGKRLSRVKATSLPSIITEVKKLSGLKRVGAPDPDKLLAIQNKLTKANVPFVEFVIEDSYSYYDSISDDDYMIESFLNPVNEKSITDLEDLMSIF